MPRFDGDNVYLTDEEATRLRPVRRRGAQKAPTKQQVTLRLDRDVLAAWKATGRGWQTRVNEMLAAHAPRPRRVRAR